MRFSDKFHLVVIVVMMFSALGFMAYEHREDATLLGAVGMIAVFFLIMLFCMYADGRDARRHTKARRR